MKRKSLGLTVLFISFLSLTYFLGTMSRPSSKQKDPQKVTQDLAQIERPAGKTSPGSEVYYDHVGNAPKQEDTQGPESHQNLPTRFTIELAQFNKQEEAEALILKLKGQGIEGFYTPLRRGGHVIYKVRLGVYTNSDEAKETLSKITKIAKVRGEVAKLN